MNSVLKRVLVGVVGGVVTLVGVVALVAPGPGWLIIFAGLGILATEFAWAGEVMLKAKKVAKKAERKANMHRYVHYFIIAGSSLAGILLIYVFN